jgi:hypothetical protein
MPEERRSIWCVLFYTSCWGICYVCVLYGKWKNVLNKSYDNVNIVALGLGQTVLVTTEMLRSVSCKDTMVIFRDHVVLRIYFIAFIWTAWGISWFSSVIQYNTLTSIRTWCTLHTRESLCHLHLSVLIWTWWSQLSSHWLNLSVCIIIRTRHKVKFTLHQLLRPQ